MDVYSDTYLPIIMHDISQGLLIPVMVIITLLLVVTVFNIGHLLVELFTERRRYKMNRAGIVNAINDATYENVTPVVEQTALLRFQKAALVTVSRNMGLPEEPLFSLAQMEINAAAKHYKRRVAWTDILARVAPMLGLMGTLIPLGPGIAALGVSDVSMLSNSLLIAFDTTICGLVCGIISLIISKVRSGWYEEYIDTLESVMNCVVDKADEARKAGVQLPCNYTGNPMVDFDERDQRVKLEAKTQAEVAKAKAAAEAQAAEAQAVEAQATGGQAALEEQATQVLETVEQPTVPMNAAGDGE